MKPLLLTNKELLKYQISIVLKCLVLESSIENNKVFFGGRGQAMDAFRTYGNSSIYLTYLKYVLVSNN